MATKGLTVGRKDDPESSIYTMVDMGTGHLPWENYMGYNKRSHIKKICQMNASKSTPRGLCNGLSVQLEKDYNFIRSCVSQKILDTTMFTTYLIQP